VGFKWNHSIYAGDLFRALSDSSERWDTPRKVTEQITGRKELSHRWPTFLSDGRHFLFFVTDEEQPDVQGVYAGSLDTKEHHLVVTTFVGPPTKVGEPSFTRAMERS
jgi:hypothetical protein